MRSTELLFIFFLLILTTASLFGQQDFLLQPNKLLPSSKQWKDLQSQPNHIPTVHLKRIERELDSIISTPDCYKFLYNSDSTKFVAFFIMRHNNPKFERLTHFGRAVHKHYRPSPNDSILFLGYVLWGMKYKQNWYYHKDREDEFWDTVDKAAKSDFLFYVLDDIGYLNSSKAFWETGGETNQFKILSANNSYLEEYTGLPEIVGWHKTSQLRRQNDLLNERVEKLACSIEDDLWNSLRQSDSALFNSRYQSKYSGENCLVLYNSDRTNILLPILYFDDKSKPWINYYFLRIRGANMSLFSWTKFPATPINREPGDESLEVVYDIRTFIEDWNWGTVNMISNESFWKDNFTDKDVRPLVK